MKQKRSIIEERDNYLIEKVKQFFLKNLFQENDNKNNNNNNNKIIVEENIVNKNFQSKILFKFLL